MNAVLSPRDTTIGQGHIESLNLPLDRLDINNPELLKSWTAIWQSLSDEYDNDSLEDLVFLQRRYKAIEKAISDIDTFAITFSNYLFDSLLRKDFQIQKNILLAEKIWVESYIVFYSDEDLNKGNFENVIAFNKMCESLNYNVIPFIIQNELPFSYIKSLSKNISDIVKLLDINDVLYALVNEKIEVEIIKEIAVKTIYCIAPILDFCGKVEEFYSLDLENRVICFNPYSAESKAILRLRDLDDPDKWVVAVDRDEEIDLDDLDKKIRASGYLV